jgi:hypothetical protein
MSDPRGCYKESPREQIPGCSPATKLIILFGDTMLLPSQITRSHDLRSHWRAQPCQHGPFPHANTSSMAGTAPVKNDAKFSDALEDMREFARRTSFENFGTETPEHELPGVKICSDKTALQPYADALKQNLSTPFRRVRRSSTC